jgi:predicted 3-demethylubiquinone-9 3-methyltransferase (glyoxalase superfamily)
MLPQANRRRRPAFIAAWALDSAIGYDAPLEFGWNPSRCQSRASRQSTLAHALREGGREMTDTKIQPFLMFEGKADEAMNFYVSLFPGAEVLDIFRYGPNGPGPEGSIMKARFRIGSQTILCTDGCVKHDFSFTSAFSRFVDCESEDEIRRLYDALLAGGMAPLPIAFYGFSRTFGWVNDRYGVSWQLNLP